MPEGPKCASVECMPRPIGFRSGRWAGRATCAWNRSGSSSLSRLRAHPAFSRVKPPEQSLQPPATKPGWTSKTPCPVERSWRWRRFPLHRAFWCWNHVIWRCAMPRGSTSPPPSRQQGNPTLQTLAQMPASRVGRPCWGSDRPARRRCAWKARAAWSFSGLGAAILVSEVPCNST